MKKYLWLLLAVAGAIAFFALAFWGENNESSEHSSLEAPAAYSQSLT